MCGSHWATDDSGLGPAPKDHLVYIPVYGLYTNVLTKCENVKYCKHIRIGCTQIRNLGVKRKISCDEFVILVVKRE